MCSPLGQIAEFCDLIPTYDTNEQSILRQALEVAQKSHMGQKRKSGEPYIIHPVSVAVMLHHKYKNAYLTAAALLHDTAEDCDEVNVEQLYTQFGGRIGFLVDAVTKCPLNFHHDDVVYTDRIEKLLAGGMKDVAVLLLKLGDRRHNVATINSMSNYKKIRISFETQAIYTPLKEILRFDEDVQIEDIEEIWHQFLQEHGLDTPEKIKSFLYTYYFEDCTNDMFNIAYKHPDKLTWEIKDKEQFKRLCQDENFEKNAHIIQLNSDGKKFRALFQFTDAHLIQSSETKLSFSI